MYSRNHSGATKQNESCIICSQFFSITIRVRLTRSNIRLRALYLNSLHIYGPERFFYILEIIPQKSFTNIGTNFMSIIDLRHVL